jgi:aryl-alcohol dehydrogenase-like predicted oxidoreductase
VDLLYVHDLDIFTHGSEAAKATRLEEFMAGGYRALVRLRDEGVIAGFGAGVNEWEPCDWLMERGEFDIFLLAGRFTLLEQGALPFMDKAAAKGVGVVIGAPYNSGFLRPARDRARITTMPLPRRPFLTARPACRPCAKRMVSGWSTRPSASRSSTRPRSA